jgi:hypothetical protein
VPPASADQLNGRSPQGTPLLGFLQPEEPEPLPSETIPNPASSPETSDVPGPDSGPDYDEASDPSELPGATRSTGSRAGSNPLVGAGLRDMFRNGVIIASHQAHTYLGQRTQGRADVQLYLADQQDAEAIGDPLARIAERRDGVGAMSPDTADLMAAMMGLAGYASKQIQKTAIAQKIDQRNAGIEIVPTGEDELL